MTLVADRLPVAIDATDDFRFAPGVRHALAGFRTRCTVVRLASADNELLDVPRWYTLAEAWALPGSPEAAAWSDNPVVEVGPSDSPELVIATGAPVVVLGAGIGASPWQRRVVDAVRAACSRVLVVDLSRDAAPGYIDVATGGPDAERGRRLLAMLCGPCGG